LLAVSLLSMELRVDVREVALDYVAAFFGVCSSGVRRRCFEESSAGHEAT